MINVGVVTNKPNVAANMETIIVKCSARYKLINPYSFEKLKECNIAIFDLDNLESTNCSIEDCKFDGCNVLIVGYSRNRDVLKKYDGVFLTRQKPFLKEHLISYFERLKTLTPVTRVVNTENNNRYNEYGLSADDLLSSDIFTDQELSNKLSMIINEKYNGPSTNELMNKIGLADVKPVKSTIDIVKPIQIQVNYNSQFVDDALIRYRAQKMKQLKLSAKEITEKLSKIIEHDAKRVASKQNFIKPDDIIKSVNSLKIYDEEEQLNTQDIQEVDISVQQQRSEAIDDDIRTPILVYSDDETDNFSDTELKYIKREPVQEKQKTNVVVPNKGQLDKKVQTVLTPEQIERLRKLGAKI
jgi:hypothetical protein